MNPLIALNLRGTGSQWAYLEVICTNSSLLLHRCKYYILYAINIRYTWERAIYRWCIADADADADGKTSTDVFVTRVFEVGRIREKMIKIRVPPPEIKNRTLYWSAMKVDRSMLWIISSTIEHNLIVSRKDSSRYLFLKFKICFEDFFLWYKHLWHFNTKTTKRPTSG